MGKHIFQQIHAQPSAAPPLQDASLKEGGPDAFLLVVVLIFLANDSTLRLAGSTCKKQCPYGQVCRLTQVQCFAAPCPPLEECVPGPANDAYIRKQELTILTRRSKKAVTGVCASLFFFLREEGVTPCTLRCPIGQKCVIQQVQCVRAPCPPQQRCVPMSMADGYYNPHSGPATSTTSYVAKPSPPTRPIACNLFCIKGKRCVVTSSGPKCLPSPTCEELKCPVGQVCKQDNENYAASCARVQSDNPLGVCTPNSCPPNQKCIIQTQQNTICIPTLTCATLRCGPGTKCYPGDSSNDAQCVPYSTCSNTPCDSNSSLALFVENGSITMESSLEGGPGRDARCVANVGGFVGRNAASFDAPRPCTLACAIGTTCVVTPSGPSCVRDAICIPTATCELLDCTSGYQCIAGGDNEDAQCIPFDTCDTLLCPPNMRCLDGGGLSNARCVAAPGCAQTCVGGTRCVKGTCVTTCQVVRCAGGQRCVETETGAQCSQTRSCDTMNCYIGTRCIEASGGADAYCAPVRDRVNPRIQSDTNGGSSNFLPPGEEERIQIECREMNCGNGRVCQDFMQKATCVIDERKSCKNLCQPGMMCVLQKVFCYAPPCYPRAVCIRAPPPQDAARKPLKPEDCGKNEMLSGCGALCEGKCENVGKGPVACPFVCLPPACACKENFYRDSNGNCVTAAQCSKSPPQDAIRKPVKPEVTAVQSNALVAAPTSSGNCPYNEVLNQCGNRCEPTCANANGQPKICPRICDPPACVCAAGLFRRNGVCVTKQQCLGPPQDAIRRPVKPEDCGNNEMLNVCGAICEGKCENVGKGPVACPFVCLPAACACCPYNEMLNQCGNRCEPTCANVDGKPRVCLAICDPPACVCATGLFRRNGVCVTKQQCLAPPQDAIRKPVKPEDCGNNEMLSGCGALCEGKCENVGKGPVACPFVCLPPACACKENFYRDSKGNCVTASQCSTYSSKQSDALVVAPTSTGSCPHNEVLNQCGNRCEPTCANVDGKPRVCLDICDPPACVCAAGLFRRNGVCVTKQQCLDSSKQSDALVAAPTSSGSCASNEVLNQCGNRCEPTCANVDGKPRVCPAICDPPACVCAAGLFRRNGMCVTKQQCLDKDTMTSYGDEPEVPLDLCSSFICLKEEICVQDEGGARCELNIPECGENEQVDNCGNRCEPTCENAYGQVKVCLLICDPPACVCKPNYYRKDGKCVPQRDCPPPKTKPKSYVDEPFTPPSSSPKPTTKSYVDEPITPPPTASTPKKNNYVDEPITPPPVYGKTSSRSYVDEPITQCSANETLSGCGNLCEGKCVNLGKGPIACPAICGPPACACKESYYRNSAGLCVTAKDCPLGRLSHLNLKKRFEENLILVCGPNEEINMCGNLCEPGCENAFGNPKVCIEICNPPACVCKPNFYRKNEKCITKNLCFPPASGNVNKNTYVDEPITPSPTGNGNKKNYVDEPITPSPKGNGNKKNYVDEPITPAPGGKSHQNSYVDEPIIRCSMNETLAECGKICEAKCENLGKGPMVCPAVCEPPSCACKNGYYRNMDGECVAEIDCPFNCGQNEQLNPCGSRCEPTCENAFGKPKACVKICDPPACVCKPDYYRKDGKCVPQMGCGVPSASATKVDTMTSYVDEPLVPSKEGSSCADTECEEGMVCVEGDIQAKCVAKDPADNCETKKCPSGAMCEYRETECIPDKACFAEAVCTGDGNTGSTPGPTGSTKTYVDEPETGGPEPNPCFNFKCPNGQECSLQSGEAKCVPKMMKCGENEKMNQCGKHCENHCTNAGKGPIQCKAPCTKPACVCDDGYYRNSLGKCVLERLCSLTGPCANAPCGLGWQCIPIEGKARCLPVPNPCDKFSCASDEDCALDHGLPYCQKKITTCPQNETRQECGSLCEGLCLLTILGNLTCGVANVCSWPSCACNEGYYRDAFGHCVLEEECFPDAACFASPAPCKETEACMVENGKKKILFPDISRGSFIGKAIRYSRYSMKAIFAVFDISSTKYSLLFRSE
ncbi:trypsin Inhibitor like cysteine rich domain protein [Necator americanus]|uniref:Trypsin Inhibitor like cysteine rich domain protein n=1 Tax=Necator americanus TaxID=51031 RepID=W2ST73_NECAM|nr:trypsin Inhibitor like cysteine rich domain protein [Necator americanus]ETN72713.1 trypsin Inhibitor like cysteine rich domain protein [Necator americanus]